MLMQRNPAEIPAMKPQVSPGRYTRTAIGLHWVTAVLVLFMFGLGWYMVDLPKGPERGANFALHKQIGILIFLITVVRLVWRARHPAPPLPDTLPAWQNRLAFSVHRLFYVVLILHPLTGFASAQFAGYGTRFFGIPLPQWGWEDKSINTFFTGCHEITALILLILIICHLAGAISHILKKGDHLVRRMLP